MKVTFVKRTEKPEKGTETWTVFADGKEVGVMQRERPWRPRKSGDGLARAHDEPYVWVCHVDEIGGIPLCRGWSAPQAKRHVRHVLSANAAW